MSSPVHSNRRLPAMNRILADTRVDPLCAEYGRDRVRDWARAILSRWRQGDATRVGSASADALLSRIVEELRSMAAQSARSRLQHVINGTGVLLHTNLGRAPLARAAQEAIEQTASSSNLELDLSTGTRGQRTARVEAMWCELTGAEAALVVNNCAAATFLTLRSLARGREVIISRGQLIEIGGSYRLPDVFAEADVLLREVGTTNRTRLSDYEHAIGEQTAAIVRVHQSNYRQIGFTESVETADLAELARRHGLPLIDDIGSGCLVDLSPCGLHEEPTVGQSLQDGADVVLFSGDKLLGGPQCGMILGRKESVDLIRQSPLTRVLRVGKLTLAALEATLRIYLAGRGFEEIPVLKAIAQPPDRLRQRAEQVRGQVLAAGSSADVRVQPMESTVGGGSLPGDALPSWGVAVTTPDCTRLAAALRACQPALVPRIRQGAVCVDLRTVEAGDDALVVDALVHALQGE